MNIDVSQVYERFCWLYIRLILLDMGFSWPIVKWIMGCLTSISFGVLKNVSDLSFFNPTRGLS